MALIHCHRFSLRIQSLILIILFIGCSVGKTLPKAKTTDVQELNVKFTDLAATMEKIYEESKLKDNKLEEFKIQWSQESKLKDYQIDTLQQQVSALKSRIDMITENGQQQNLNPENRLNIQVNGQNETIMAKTHQIHKRVPEPEPPVNVAFHASVSHDMTPQSNVHIIYDHVLLDTANAYNRRTGVFTVPESGIYVMTWTTSIDRHGQLWSQLMVNLISYGHILSDSEEIRDNDTATGIFVIQLTQGDYVNIQFEPGHNKGTSFSLQLYYITFMNLIKAK